KGWKDRRAALASLAAAAGLLVVLLVPWILQVQGGVLADRVASGVVNQSPVQSLLIDYANWRDMTAYVSLPLLILAGLGFVVALLRRRWLVAGLLVWTALLAAVRAATLIRLPG
ncbi:MAG TPA: hypothetical protein PJ988_18020, partial [Anaerolinea sp.]|nr:hypothetical protein [Anaerolinea sp.]